MTTRLVLVAIGATLVCGAARGARAQRDTAVRVDSASTQCDSIVAAARVDSVPVTFWADVVTSNGVLAGAQRQLLLFGFLDSLTLPQPFRLAVFASGAPATRALRRIGSSEPELRRPTVTGVYEFTTAPADSQRVRVVGLHIMRPSLVPGLDSAVVRALATANIAADTGMRVQLRFTTEATPGGEPLVSSSFPRLPVVDAAPLSTNPVPEYPDSAAASGETDEVVLRFVVDRDGLPVTRTAEIVRAADPELLRAAVPLLPDLRFHPATVAGCPVAQVIDYPFSFVPPPRP